MSMGVTPDIGRKQERAGEVLDKLLELATLIPSFINHVPKECTGLLGKFIHYTQRNLARTAQAAGITDLETFFDQMISLLEPNNCRDFVMWLATQPSFWPTAVQKYGLKEWPYLGQAVDRHLGGETVEEIQQGLALLTLHPDASHLIASNIAALRTAISAEIVIADLGHRRIEVAREVFDMNPERLAAIEALLLQPYIEEAPTEQQKPEQPYIRIEELDLSVRTYNHLKGIRVATVQDLTRSSAEELLNIRYFGRKCLQEVRDKLRAYGYTLAGESLTPQGDENK